ncbi:MAG: LPS export ABC transporter permease LptF [Nitrospina sp.]|nr:LPS export ABC transporter permease LptF [Nitrospina sp.]
MKIIYRYITGELLKIFIVSTVFLTGILFLDKLLFIAKLILNRGVSLGEMSRMMLYISPAFLAITIPMSVLVASVVVFNQLSGDNEFVVMKSSGWSFLYLMRPVMTFALIAYILNNIVIFYALPWGNYSFKKMVFDIVRHRANLDIKPNVFNRDFNNLIIYAKSKKGGSELGDLFVADTSTPGSNRIILSKKGTIVTDPDTFKIQLQLRNGTIHNTTQQGRNYQILNFDRYDVNLALPKTGILEHELLANNRDMSLGALLKTIKEKKERGETVFREEVELSKKFSIPLTCLLFALTGAPLGIKSSRSGKSGGFALCAVIILVYYVGLVSTQNLGSFGKLPPLLSVWIPNLILAAFTFMVVYKAHREIPFVILDSIMDFAAGLAGKVARLIQNIGGGKQEPVPTTRPFSMDNLPPLPNRESRAIFQNKPPKVKADPT